MILIDIVCTGEVKYMTSNIVQEQCFLQPMLLTVLPCSFYVLSDSVWEMLLELNLRVLFLTGFVVR